MVTTKGEDGSSIILREVKPGDSFGEISVVDPSLTTTSSVSATAESLLMRLPIDKISTFLRVIPELATEFNKLTELNMRDDLRAHRTSVSANFK